MPAGGTVTISAENHTLAKDDALAIGPGEFVRLAVTDTGTGISPEDLEKVMEPFFTTKEVGKGSGLGLSMVYGFAKQSNGLFRITSTLGKGTTAEVWLPRAPEEKRAAKPLAKDGVRSAPQAPLRILLVDDHAEVRGTTATVLTHFGHSITEAANGMEAIRILEDGKCKFDLLITDYAMPQVSGTGVIAKARELYPEVPALIMTGYAESSVIADRPEGVEVLLKPFTPPILEQAIARVTAAQAVGPAAV
jgi:CheY-like chemotaxis protein